MVLLKLNTQGEELGSTGFQNYITKFKEKPNNERLQEIIDNICLLYTSDAADE